MYGAEITMHGVCTRMRCHNKEHDMKTGQPNRNLLLFVTTLAFALAVGGTVRATEVIAEKPDGVHGTALFQLLRRSPRLLRSDHLSNSISMISRVSLNASAGEA